MSKGSQSARQAANVCSIDNKIIVLISAVKTYINFTKGTSSVYVCVCVCVCVRACVRACVRMRECVFLCVYACVYVCVHTFYVCMYACINMFCTSGGVYILYIYINYI